MPATLTPAAPQALTPQERAARARVAIEVRWALPPAQRAQRLIDVEIEFHSLRLRNLQAQREALAARRDALAPDEVPA